MILASSGPPGGPLEGLLGCLGTLGSRKGGNTKISSKPKEKQRILPPGAFLGVLLEASWGVWGPS